MVFKALQALILGLITKKYDACNFKLIFNDLGLANLIVRSKEDLTVVGVVDLEWSYIGPAQLFGSAPWWLQDRPEKEECMPENEEKELSSLVKWPQDSGAMWLHMLISFGFNDHRSFPFIQLRRYIRGTKRAQYEEIFDDAEEIDTFAMRKVSQLDEYDEAPDGKSACG
ncbi:hypothetical protein TSTA_049120 [Talaromyces stipitatus ATCC 10500]|uniref:Aminoglycoside phosphotransferase domain-containing protein n=1 Tax=Talaromyces stipitatus (strain ATCC 10500 / CBS 375.48 / QM 6759 / NRRL 1006) TaxID=441959 RepID=B8ML56_TALSN|nr:uncharacterized protein TSTA_049120 [Talaromyces stipitatus ATCC 10500]EED15472.1 hypothetical protein TSTA_049120 [Talaromyces stipitatus ATCC 10500]